MQHSVISESTKRFLAVFNIKTNRKDFISEELTDTYSTFLNKLQDKSFIIDTTVRSLILVNSILIIAAIYNRQSRTADGIWYNIT